MSDDHFQLSLFLSTRPSHPSGCYMCVCVICTLGLRMLYMYVCVCACVLHARLCVRLHVCTRRVFIRCPFVRPPAHRQQRTRHVRSLCRRRRLYRVSRTTQDFPETRVRRERAKLKKRAMTRWRKTVPRSRVSSPFFSLSFSLSFGRFKLGMTLVESDFGKYTLRSTFNLISNGGSEEAWKILL